MEIWTLPFASEPVKILCKPTDKYRYIENNMEKIMENNPGLDKNILEILIGIKTKQEEKEEQLLSNARYILPTLTIKNWTTWCKLINSGNIKQKIENEMEHHMIYEPTENLDYIIRKILRQEYR